MIAYNEHQWKDITLLSVCVLKSMEDLNMMSGLWPKLTVQDKIPRIALWIVSAARVEDASQLAGTYTDSINY